MRDVVQEISTQVFMPLTVGGGIKSVDDMTALLKAGADKVSLNSAALSLTLSSSQKGLKSLAINVWW